MNCLGGISEHQGSGHQDPRESITGLVSCYNTTLSDLLDKHAPLFKKTITVRPRVP